MNKTSIEYLDYTCNPLAMRCTPIAIGCTNCWHLTTCDRLKENYYSFGHKIRDAYSGEGPPILVESRLNAPLKRKEPSIIGVQFMGDIAHEKVSDDQRDTIFGVMCAASWHTFIILTKRPKALLRWYNDTDILGEGDFYPNVWIGVSISTQEDADQLIPFLLQIPAAVRIVSVEPMLGEINLRGGTYDLDWLNGWCVETEGEYDRRDGYFYRVPIQAQTEKIDGVIIGCESGPKRRPCKIERIENLIGQCVDTGTPVFVKQAEIDGKVVSMPRIMDRTWDQLPNQASPDHPGRTIYPGVRGNYG